MSLCNIIYRAIPLLFKIWLVQIFAIVKKPFKQTALCIKLCLYLGYFLGTDDQEWDHWARMSEKKIFKLLTHYCQIVFRNDCSNLLVALPPIMRGVPILPYPCHLGVLHFFLFAILRSVAHLIFTAREAEPFSVFISC